MKPIIPCITLAIFAASAHAQQPSAVASDWPAAGRLIVTASLRAWVAEYNTTPFDAQFIVGPGGTPLISTFTNSASSSTKVAPIVAVSATMDRFTLSGSFMPEIDFNDSAVPGGKTGRSEYDISLAYSIVPGLSAAVIYKGGKVTEVATSAAQTILGVRGDAKINGLLLGVSGSAPLGADLVRGLNLYGNVAAGRGKIKPDFGPRENISYLVSEVGLSWAINQGTAFGPFSSALLQVGYRAQTLSGPVTHQTIDPATRAVVATTRSKSQTTTRGPVIGLTMVF